MTVRTTRVRLRISIVVLSVIWAMSFATVLVPFFPTVLIGGLLTGLAAWWVRRAAPGRLPAFRVAPRWVAVALAVALAHYTIGRLAFTLVRSAWPGFAHGAAEIYVRTAEVPLILALLYAAVLTAPLEELFWRGAVQPVVGANEATAVRRVLAGAAVYTAFHVVTLQPALTAAAALGGLVWGWLGERSGSLVAPIVAHAVWTGLMIAFPPV